VERGNLVHRREGKKEMPSRSERRNLAESTLREATCPRIPCDGRGERGREGKTSLKRGWWEHRGKALKDVSSVKRTELCIGKLVENERPLWRGNSGMGENCRSVRDET